MFTHTVLLILSVLLISIASACDCQQKWKMYLSRDTDLPLYHYGVFSPILQNTTVDAVKEFCYNQLIKGEKSGEVYMKSLNVIYCEGFAYLEADHTAYTFYRYLNDDIHHPNPPDLWHNGGAITNWKTGRDFYFFDRFRDYNCYIPSFDAVYYYFNSGERDNIDYFQCAFKTASAGPRGCCWFNIDSSLYSSHTQSGWTKNCNSMLRWADPNATDTSFWRDEIITDDYLAVAKAMDGVSGLLIPIVTRYYMQIGHKKKSTGINPNCRPQITPYDPTSKCAQIRDGCGLAGPNVEICSGHGYCAVNNNVWKIDHAHDYWCDCRRYGDVPESIPEGAVDYTNHQADYDGIYKYSGSSCQVPDAYKGCVNSVTGDVAVCGEPSSANSSLCIVVYEGYISTKTREWQQRCDSTCGSPESPLQGTFCTDSKCTHYNSSKPDEYACTNGESAGVCRVNTVVSMTWVCDCINGHTGRLCELSDANCHQGTSTDICSGNGQCVYNLLRSDPSSVHCVCDANINGTHCETISCDPLHIAFDHGFCPTSPAYINDATTCKHGTNGGGDFAIYKSSSSDVQLHCDVDICSLYEGVAVNDPRGQFATCNCKAAWTYQGVSAPSNYYKLNPDKSLVLLQSTQDPTCFPRCLDDCSKMGKCVASIVNQTTHYTNCKCDAGNVLNISHPELGPLANYYPPPGQSVFGCVVKCLHGSKYVLSDGSCDCSTTAKAWKNGAEGRCEENNCGPHGYPDPNNANACICNGPYTASSFCSADNCKNDLAMFFVEGYANETANRCVCYPPFHPSTSAGWDCNAFDCGAHSKGLAAWIVDGGAPSSRCECFSPYNTPTCTVTGMCPYCSLDMCQNGGKASNTSHGCNCPPMWYDLDLLCTTNHCQHDGIPTADGLACSCVPPFIGTFCEFDGCDDSKTIDKEGIANVFSHQCTCNLPYFSTSAAKTDCDGNGCGSLGHLVSPTPTDHSQRCTCDFPWGTVCSSESVCDYCQTSLCQHGGSVKNASCSCPFAWSDGGLCSVSICTHLHQYLNATDLSKCYCEKDYSGENCTLHHGSVDPCLNGGSWNGSVCTCPFAWNDGLHCGVTICNHTHEMLNNSDWTRCYCSANYTGVYCATHIEPPVIEPQELENDLPLPLTIIDYISASFMGAVVLSNVALVGVAVFQAQSFFTGVYSALSSVA